MIVTLKNNGFSAKIDSYGAQLISLQDPAGTEYIWQRDPKHWANCSPLLFPIVGNCRDNKLIIDGRSYNIIKHGFCKITDFTVSQPSGSEATFTIQDSEETRKSYPYAFCLTLTYTLDADGQLHMNYKVKNTDTQAIHYLIGTHPGFTCPLKDGEKFEDYVLEFEKEENAGFHSYNAEKLEFDMTTYTKALDHSRVLPINYPLFANDAIFFTDLVSKKVALKNPATGKGVEVAYPDFETIAFWTAAATKAPFLCVEPWNGSAIRSDEDNDFMNRHYLQNLGVGETKEYRMDIRIL